PRVWSMASQMNWAGNERLNSSCPRCGAPNCAKGMDPESYQTSITSGTRRAVSPQSGHEITTWSTYGRCGSIPVRSRPASSDSSASEPTQVVWPPGHSQTGSGVPQYRVRDSAQSMLLRSHSPYRPCLMVGGCQPVCSFTASSRALIAVVRMNQDGTA